MPNVYEFDRKDYEPDIWIVGEDKDTSTLYWNESLEKHGEGFESLINLVKDNKDLIVESGKAIGSLASAAGKISDAIKSSSKEEDIKLIRKLREERQKKLPLSVEKKIEQSLKKSGDGFAKF